MTYFEKRVHAFYLYFFPVILDLASKQDFSGTMENGNVLDPIPDTDSSLIHLTYSGKNC